MPRIFISARTGEGMPGLRQLLVEAVDGTLEGFLNRHEAAPDDKRLLAIDDPVDDALRDPSPPVIHHSLA